MVLEHELAFAATCCWVRSCWEGRWADGMSGAWKREIFNASSWIRVQEPTGAVSCELKDARMQRPACDTFAAGDTLFGCGVIAPSEMKQFLLKRELLRWRDEQIDEMDDGVWFELFLKEKLRLCGLKKRKNRARHWMIAVTQDAKVK